MADRIIHDIEVEAATVKITCGSKSGTAFFVPAAIEGSILLTSDHTLTESDSNPIQVELRSPDSQPSTHTAKILHRITDKDVAIVQLDEPVSGINGLPLVSQAIAAGSTWTSFGFPVIKVNAGGKFTGTVARLNDGTKWDSDLECDQYTAIKDFRGLSGAPLVINGAVTAVIGYDLTGTLGATSIFSIADILSTHHILIESQEASEVIPASILEESEDAEPNSEVLDKISDTIKNQPQDSYFILSGNPGSGKTTICAQLELENPSYVVCDRYFVKVPLEDKIPTQIRATTAFFLDWVEGVVARVLFNSAAVKSDKPIHERLQAIHQGLIRLGDYYAQKDSVAVLVVDGLDDVDPKNITDFLSVLPSALLPHLKILISCTSKNILPGALQSQFHDNNEIRVTPLAIQKASAFLEEKLKSKSIPKSQIQQLAEKSEGHPLYLRYLSKYVSSLENPADIDGWIDTIPKISGDIEIYYKNIWAKLKNNPDEVFIASTISRIRQPIEKNVLYEILPAQSKIAFPTAFSKIDHLLKSDDQISIYHSSFSEFINNRTSELSKDIHDNISAYCIKNDNLFFCLSEKIYHLLNGNENNRALALELCNQEWIDNCALLSVNPDIVLADIRQTLIAASDLGIAHKVIQLLLLSQRVNFRYNTLFDENATYLINALLALEKPDEAIRYIVRNGALMVADGDALYFLHRFYEYGAKEEAEELLASINKTCHTIYDQGLNSDTFSRYLNLRFSALTLSVNTKHKEAFDEFSQLKQVTKKVLKKSGNSSETIHSFQDDVGSFNIGYYIWRYGLPPSTKFVEKELADKFKFDDKSSGFIALSILQAIEFQKKSPLLEKKDFIKEHVEDLEYALDKYGSHEDYYRQILRVLLKNSKRTDLVEQFIAKTYAAAPAFSFRAENGVDLDHRGIYDYSLYMTSIGYSDSTKELPKIGPIRFSNWEDSLKKLYEYVCLLSGKAYRLTAEGRANEIESLKDPIKIMLAGFNFSLENRMHWERSYSIPELVMPVIYTKTIGLLIKFFPDEIDSFVQSLVSKSNYQLGVYTEGYIDSIFPIARLLSKHSEHKVPAFNAAKILEEHILSTVENRWERNEYLLRLTEIYASLDNKDKADEMFREMIATSMGPSWYKEAQLGIINTTVSYVLPKTENNDYLQQFAGHLQHASGEMTFQRYVKQQQESFAGDLAKINRLDTAIEYFKFLVFPEYKMVIKNAESDLADMPDTGDGYQLGAKAINEQAAVLDILTNIDCGSSLVAWGLSELFTPGDDRYLRGFAAVQTKIINKVAESQPGLLNTLIKRIVRFIVTETDNEYRYEYIGDLIRDLTPANFKLLTEELKEAGFKPHEPGDKEIIPSSRESDPLDKLVDFKKKADEMLHMENKSGARSIIIEGLKETQRDKYSIWSHNYSEKIDSLVDSLADAYNTSSELIKSIKDLLTNEPYYEEWVIANRLIKILRNIDDEAEKKKIVEAVLEHIHLMVRTPQSTIEDYQWMQNPESNAIDQEQAFLEFLIWFLNHPAMVVKNRAMEILVWLGISIPERVIPALYGQLDKEGYRISKELSAATLHQIAKRAPSLFWGHFKKCIAEQGQLSTRHFMIVHSIIEALEAVISIGSNPDAKTLLQDYEGFFSTDTNTTDDIDFDNDALEPVSDILYQLNDMGILTENFKTEFNDALEKLAPANLGDCLKADKYIARSFNDFSDIHIISDYFTLLHYTLNATVLPYVSVGNRKLVAKLLRFYQPTFPENILCQKLVNTTGTESILAQIIKGASPNIDVLYKNDSILLHYSSTTFDSNPKEVIEYEVTAFLVPINLPESDFLSPWLTFPANDYPLVDKEDFEDGIKPLVIRSSFQRAAGSDSVPSFPSTYILELISADANSSFERLYWRNGRNWEQRGFGKPLKTGYSLSLPAPFLEPLKKEYRLIWEINSGYKTVYIDIFDRKILDI